MLRRLKIKTWIRLYYKEPWEFFCCVEIFSILVCNFSLILHRYFFSFYSSFISVVKDFSSLLWFLFIFRNFKKIWLKNFSFSFIQKISIEKFFSQKFIFLFFLVKWKIIFKQIKKEQIAVSKYTPQNFIK